jgi:phenylacetyl-CoA:acceptor oxidoreductase subunit 2
MNWGAASRLQRLWDIRAAGNFIGGGTGSSLLFWAALGLVGGLPYFQAGLIGLMFVGAGLLLVWLEIGKPWRAFNVFFRPRTSWMTREGIVALPLFALGAIAVLFDANLGLFAVSRSPLVPALITAVLGMVFLYCQVHILHSAGGVPAWREPLAMPLVGLSGLIEGLGIYLLVTAVLGTVPIAFLIVAMALLLARMLAWRAYIAGLTRSSVPQATLTALLAIRSSFLIVGHVLPLSLIVAAIFWPDMTVLFSALAGIAAALGGWWFKIVLIVKAAFRAEFTIPIVPVRGRPGSPNDTPDHGTLSHSPFGSTD